MSASAYVVENLAVGCGCIRGLFQEVDVKHIQVTPSDVSRLVLDQIDETELRTFITQTVPSSDDINELYSQSALESKFEIIM